jgi:hypothetical protein
MRWTRKHEALKTDIFLRVRTVIEEGAISDADSDSSTAPQRIAPKSDTARGRLTDSWFATNKIDQGRARAPTVATLALRLTHVKRECCWSSPARPFADPAPTAFRRAPRTKASPLLLVAAKACREGNAPPCQA